MAKSFIGINGFNPNDYAKFDNGINIYTHTRSGTVNEFTGTGPNGRALMTADIEAGDTFTVNGVPVSAFVGTYNAVEVMNGADWKDKWVSFAIDDGAIYFFVYGERKPNEIQFPVSDGVSIGVDGATYFKTTDGVVTINFSLQGTFPAFSEHTILGVMPVGYRPSHPAVTAVSLQGTAGATSWAKVMVQQNGNVVLFTGEAGTIVSGSLTYLPMQ